MSVTIIVLLLVIALINLAAASIGLVDGVGRFATASLALATRLLDLLATRR